MAAIDRIGFGQVELNHVASMVTGKIYAQLPADTTLGNILENGRFVKYDMNAGKVNLTGAGKWKMIYNEIKLYDERLQGYKDFAMKKADAVDGEMVPRVIAIEEGDIITMNIFGAATSEDAQVSGPTLVAGDKLAVTKATGYLAKITGSDTALDLTGPEFQVVKVTTTPDGVQAAVKLQCIQ